MNESVCHVICDGFMDWWVNSSGTCVSIDVYSFIGNFKILKFIYQYVFNNIEICIFGINVNNKFFTILFSLLKYQNC